MRVERRWSRSGLSAAVYDLGVQNEAVARSFGRLLWGTDMTRLYADIAALGELPADGSVLDVPCGGGVAFRGLRPDRRLDYVAADLSPTMLERARTRALRYGLRHIRYVRAGVRSLPFADGSFDTCLSYNGLHCFADPAAAAVEMARVLRPGGTLRGSAIVTGAGVRQDAAVTLLRWRAMFGPAGGAGDLRDWLDGAGLAECRVETAGAIAFFRARKAE